MSEQFTVRGARIVSTRETVERDIAVRDGIIVAVNQPGSGPAAGRVIDADGLYLLPGLVDSHVHLRDPDGPHREDFESGTAAAATGGVTSVIEMPISRPGVHNAAVLAGRVDRLVGRAHVDVGFYGGAGRDNLADIAGLAAAGVLGFKTFLHPPAPGREEDFRGLWVADVGELRDAMAATSATGLPHAVHCEDQTLINHLRRQRHEAPADGAAHANTQPPLVEEVAVAMALAVAADTGARLHVVHLSSPRSAALVADARRRGQTVTSEVCPNHLFLTVAALHAHGPYSKCNPPLRDAATVAGLWQAVETGWVDVIGSDHAPFAPREKQLGETNIFAAPPGIPAIELTLPLLLDAVVGERLSLPRLVQLAAARPAELFGLPHKGKIEVGADADFVLVDLSAASRVDVSQLRSRSRDNLRAYDGRELRGRLQSTYLRGREIFADGTLVGDPGNGRWLRRRGGRT